MVEKDYLVALACGGLMEQPDFTFSAPLIIRAKSPQEATEKYNSFYKCDYFYGCVLALRFNKNWILVDKYASQGLIEDLLEDIPGKDFEEEVKEFNQSNVISFINFQNGKGRLVIDKKFQDYDGTIEDCKIFFKGFKLGLTKK